MIYRVGMWYEERTENKVAKIASCYVFGIIDNDALVRL